MFKSILAGATAAVMLVAAAPAAPVTSAHDIQMTTIDGKPMPFAQYKGKVLLVVNTASFCGYTPQYEGLQKLYADYKDKGFVLIGVPSGDFLGQEYKSNGAIKEFCESKFGIRFPMTEKQHVKGKNAAPFYKWAAATLGSDKAPTWNFHKYLVGKNGELITAFGSKVAPQDTAVTAAVEAALASGG